MPCDKRISQSRCVAVSCMHASEASFRATPLDRRLGLIAHADGVL